MSGTPYLEKVAADSEAKQLCVFVHHHLVEFEEWSKLLQIVSNDLFSNSR